MKILYNFLLQATRKCCCQVNILSLICPHYSDNVHILMVRCIINCRQMLQYSVGGPQV